MFCPHCGHEVASHAVVCVSCGGGIVAAATGQTAPSVRSQSGQVPKSRLAYILLGLFLGGFGIHNFFAGYVGRGVTQLLITLVIGWLIVPLFAVWIWVLVEICLVDHAADGTPFN